MVVITLASVLLGGMVNDISPELVELGEVELITVVEGIGETNIVVTLVETSVVLATTVPEVVETPFVLVTEV